MSSDANKVISNDANLLYKDTRPSFSSRVNDVVNNLPHNSIEYVKSIFPIRTWIGRYNTSWLVRDAIAGFTVGAVIIPQSMGFANIIGIPVQYGLYASFVGMLAYFVFATTKDMTIGPTAVMSIILSQVVPRIQADYESANIPYSPQEIITTICFFSGIFSLLIGFFRLGWIFNFIPGE